MAPEDPTDLLVTLDAEDAFDVGGQLHRISAPALVIGGGRDAFYPRELFEQTAVGVHDGRSGGAVQAAHSDHPADRPCLRCSAGPSFVPGPTPMPGPC
jgi:pimeloyl-ACP methyl ester carboxylesterase